MSANLKGQSLPATEQLQSRSILQGLVFFYLLIALGVFLVVPILAVNWVSMPYPGGFLDQSLVFNGQGVVTQAVPPAGSQLTMVDHQPVITTPDLNAVLRGHKIGDEVSLIARTPLGSQQTYRAILTSFPFELNLAYSYLPYFIGLVYLACALWIFFLRRHETGARVFVVFSTSIAIVAGALFEVQTTHFLTAVWTAALALAGAAFLNLALSFPRPDPLLTRFPFLRAVPYAVAAILAVIAIIPLYDASRPLAYLGPRNLIYIFLIISLLLMLTIFLGRRMAFVSPTEREQIWLMVLASLVSFAPAFLLISAPLFSLNAPFSPYIMVCLIVFPLLVSLTVQRYNLLYTDFIFSRATLYGLMVILVTIGYALLVSGFGVIFNTLTPAQNPIITGIIIFILALVFNRLRQDLKNAVDALFLKGNRAFQEELQALGSEMARADSLLEIIKSIRSHIDKSLFPDVLHIYIYDTLNDQYIATPGSDKEPTSDLRFPSNSLLVQHLKSRDNSLFYFENNSLPADLQPEKARLALLAAQIYIPLTGQDRLAGWFALGRRSSGGPYSSPEIKFLTDLSDQAALAIERAQVIANMEQRVRAMNALARVAQGINITLDLDDILELINAQTTQIVPADDFHILLLDSGSGVLSEIFYVRQNERLRHFENKPVGQTLEQEIIRQRKPMVTTEYVRECQAHGILASETGLCAWMCVPLNAGAETIGALSLGSRDQSVAYTQEQLNLVQAIADQVAGAIVKARLLEETRRHAHQLTSLNEVSRQLTSTLEIEPLLKNILESAVEILNCEAGSLLMVDSQTDDLVFRVTAGPVAGDLINHRMPSGSGLVGKAVLERQPVMVNNVQASSEWFSKTDQETGFVTRSLLVVPMQIKEAIIGVIEVINKRDFSPFNQNDQELLSAFSAQAAVALENARLYTMTDQALAERVEELSVLQRIGRELNTSLDTTRAMTITLEWAVRQSGASAGLVGVMEEKGLRPVASHGYSDELGAYTDAAIPLEVLDLQNAVDSGAPQHIPLNGKSGLFKDARYQVVVPLRRETRTIGILLLESADREIGSEDTLNFLLRLSDQASIALSNTQLYAAVQAANLAKSEFVSFVSHELKNPMTSIKGYTELLSIGAVGAVNEAQANFLNTIHSNVERMATLVTDLADVSRIEANRLRLDFKPQKSKEVLDEIIRSLRKQLEEKGQEVLIDLPEDLPPVWADRTRFSQVMTNLISNSYKYTPQGGKIKVSGEACDNIWAEGAAPRVVHFSVADTGIGIGPEDQKKIFQKFFRSEDPKTREVPGTGLGLNITKSLVELQGGTIWFESEIGKGTVFHFTLPVSS